VPQLLEILAANAQQGIASTQQACASKKMINALHISKMSAKHVWLDIELANKEYVQGISLTAKLFLMKTARNVLSDINSL